MTDRTEDRTLTLKEAAALLRVSYSTVYTHKKRLGFFQVGAVWRVWLSTLMNLGSSDKVDVEHNPLAKQNNSTSQAKVTPFVLGLSQSEIEAELDRILARPSKQGRHNP